MSNSNRIAPEYTDSSVPVEVSLEWLMNRILEDRAESVPVSEEAGNGE
jgi:hypothetical protein